MVHDLNFLYSEWLEEVIIYMLLKIPVLRKVKITILCLTRMFYIYPGLAHEI